MTTRALLATIALLMSGCTAPSAAPQLVWTTCPADVEATFLSRHECGYLTVLEDRAKPTGRTIRLFLVKAWPVGIDPAPGIGIGLGGNIGDRRPVDGGNAAGATRLGRVGVQLESRGTGPHADPSLACPEVDDRTTSFVNGVSACYRRLSANGVDVASYDVAEAAEDVEDLRRALGIDRWATIGSEGSTSRYAFEYLRRHPQRAAAVYLDSPWFPDVDDLTGGIAATRAALAELFAACRAKPECRAAHPRLAVAWQQALHRLAITPLRLPDAVNVDDALLLRLVRAALGGDGPSAVSALPRIIDDAARGAVAPELARLVARLPVSCAGYLPLCGRVGTDLGVYLTTLCRDEVPFLDRAALDAAASEPAYRKVFVDSPYLAACAAWPVPPGEPATRQAGLPAPVPLLLLAGQFDAFTTAVPGKLALAGRAWPVRLAGQTHNVLGHSECALTIRNAWVRSPHSPPADTSCATH